jgi:D-tyrosyl-tRNA(Tyr) deacylase
VVQRVREASVTVAGTEVGRIGPGLLVLVGVTHTDTEAGASALAAKVWHLRILDDDGGVMNRSLAESGGEVLVVSQFTLYGDTSRGRRPSWVAAAPCTHPPHRSRPRRATWWACSTPPARPSTGTAPR